MPHWFDIRTLDAYAWAFDLAAADDATREAALQRHITLLWRQFDNRPTGTLADPVRAFATGQTELTADEVHRLEPYALLSIQWPKRFPADWRRVRDSCPPMRSAVPGFIRHGASPESRPALEGLILDAVHRPHAPGGGDEPTWQLARRIDNPALRDRLRAAADGPDLATRLRAGYALWLVEHPRNGITPRSWRRWRRSHGVPITHPRPAPGLAALPATAAAAELAGLDTPGLAAVFEALEPAPAARIAAAMGDVATVAAAIAAMQVHTAAWMFNSMPQQLAADLLAAMPPEVAAVRFPRPKRDQVLLLMSAEDATARLSLMPPLRAAQQLRWRPADVAAGLLTGMDPDAAARALATLSGGWGPGRILDALPAGVASGLLDRMGPRDRDRVRWTVERERFEAAAWAAQSRAVTSRPGG